ncbi:MAG TPA: radical SAM/SPASM domain-containing protein, partial [Euryarchaeota archaeon]|nr:radical SAM/SPASM domain-containing protein [Euryarchaeota archaeon]
MSEKPVSVMWESTIACGLKCKHCKASAKTKPDPNELTTEESFELI